MAWLQKRRFRISGSRWLHVCSWLIRPIQDRQTQLKVWSGFYVEVPSPALLIFEGGSDGCFQRETQHDCLWDTRRHCFQLGSTINNGRCDKHQMIFSSSPCIAFWVSIMMAKRWQNSVILDRQGFLNPEMCSAWRSWDFCSIVSMLVIFA